MIPLRDVNPSPRKPVVNYLIIVSCILVFIYERSLGRALPYFLVQYGLVPIRYTNLAVAMHFTVLEQLIPFLSCMFLHGGWLHLIGNMWTLYIFGDNVEGAVGHLGYLVFYLLCGLCAGILHVVTNFHSQIPTIGASGAIAGVMGAYFVLYPRARILTLIPIFFFFTIIEIPAYFFLGLWFVIQFFSGTFALTSGMTAYGGIAWWAHVGGFLAGMYMLRFFVASSRDRASTRGR